MDKTAVFVSEKPEFDILFEKLGKQWSNPDEETLIDLLCDILNAVSIE